MIEKDLKQKKNFSRNIEDSVLTFLDLAAAADAAKKFFSDCTDIFLSPLVVVVVTRIDAGPFGSEATLSCLLGSGKRSSVNWAAKVTREAERDLGRNFVAFTIVRNIIFYCRVLT